MGKPPARMRSTYSSLVTGRAGISGTLAGSAQSQSMKVSRLPCSSPWDNGRTLMMCARPVSDCAACGRTEYLVDPVST